MSAPAPGTSAAALWQTAQIALTGTLASDAARARLDRAIGPAGLAVHQLLLECDVARDRLDFAVVTDERPAAGEVQPAFLATLERIAAHAAWATGDAAQAAAIFREVWLEFDIAPSSGRTPARPSGFFGLDRQLVADRQAVARLAALLAADGDFGQAEAQWPAWQRAYERELAPLLAAQPKQVVRYLGRMDAREARSVRYHLGPVHADTVAQWRALPASVRPALALADWLVLGVDLDPAGAGPRWGLELVFRSPTRHLGRWRPVVDALVGAGLLPADTPEAIAAWTGATLEPADAGAWLPAFLGEGGGFYHVRTLNHIKLVFAPDTPVTAKVYLANDRRGLPADSPGEA